jgi:heparan-alpha-glucosaminide N-acetyltransferase
MASANPPPLAGASRVAAIDIFRGLTVLVMVFVDNVGMVKGLPWWTYHMPREANGMTYVDMVFPAFLFLAGMSIPLAIKRRLASGDSRAWTWVHVVIRSLSLVILGLFIANAPQVDAARTHVSPAVWALAGFAAIGLGWNAYPSSAKRENLFRIFKLAGIVVLLGLFAAFRRTTPEGHTAWLDFSDWEILGLIGWAYLLVSTIYLLLGDKIWSLATTLVVLVTINIFSTVGWLQGLHQLSVFFQPFEAGLSAIVVSGVIVAQIFFGDAVALTWNKKLLWALGYACCLMAAAWALTPLGISKLRDTPAWCLYCAAANTLIFLFLYWIADIRRKTRWIASFRKSVGASALLPYFLAYVAYFTPSLGVLTADGSLGWPGVVKSGFFTALVLAISSFLTRLGIRLRL